jgi:hypothetical protein
MTVLTSRDTLVVEGLVHHFCGLISAWTPIHTAKRQIVAGDRLPCGLECLAIVGRLPGICWWSAMLCGERLPRHLGPDPGPLARRNRPVTWQSGLLVARGDPSRHLTRNRAGSLSEILNGTSSRVAAQMLASVRSVPRNCSGRWVATGCIPAP